MVTLTLGGLTLGGGVFAATSGWDSPQGFTSAVVALVSLGTLAWTIYSSRGHADDEHPDADEDEAHRTATLAVEIAELLRDHDRKHDAD